MALVLSRRSPTSQRAAATIVALGILAAGCGAARAPRFRLADPVERLDDEKPIPVPRATERHGERFYFHSTVSNPHYRLPYGPRIRLAADVNALNETVASTFFTPRLGRRPLTPDEVGRGPGDGPPVLPLSVYQTLGGGRRRAFLARDSRGRPYYVRLDPAGHPGLESAAAALASRLLWAFGFNTPEQHVISFSRDDITVGADAFGAEVELALARGALPVNGRYRAGATRIPDGVLLGPFSPSGVRSDDPNDRIPHQDRRALRSLRVLGAWINWAEIEPRHTMDVYEGPPGRGFVRHYLALLYETFGALTVGPDRDIDVDDRYLSGPDVMKSLLTLGLRVQPWERVGPTPWGDVGVYESDAFQFDHWREDSGYAPIRDSRPSDDYWAAKVLARFTPEQLRAAVAAAAFSRPEAGDYVLRTLQERQRKIVESAFARVTPLETERVEPGALVLRDAGRAGLPARAGRRVEVRIQDTRGRNLEPPREIELREPELRVESRHLQPGSADGYLRVVVSTRGAGPDGRAAEFHLRAAPDGRFRLVGVLY